MKPSSRRPLQPQHGKPCARIVAAKLESTAQCGTVPVLPITGPLKMSKSWVIRGAAQYLGKMKEETVREEGAHELCQLPTSLAAFADQFWKGRPTYT